MGVGVGVGVGVGPMRCCRAHAHKNETRSDRRRKLHNTTAARPLTQPSGQAKRKFGRQTHHHHHHHQHHHHHHHLSPCARCGGHDHAICSARSCKQSVHKTKTNQPGVDTLLEYTCTRVRTRVRTRVLELFNIAITIASRIFGGLMSRHAGSNNGGKRRTFVRSTLATRRRGHYGGHRGYPPAGDDMSFVWA